MKRFSLNDAKHNTPVGQERVKVWVLATDHANLTAENKQLIDLGHAVLRAVGYDEQLHESGALHEFAAALALLDGPKGDE